MPDPVGPALRVLVAYPYMSKPLIDSLAALSRQGDFEFLLDCGAYTAYETGKVITLDDYCRFLESLPFVPWRYFALDVIGDAKATRANYDTMLRRGFKPMPIFTRGAPVEDLDYYAATADLVGMGGMSNKDNAPYGYIKAMQRHMQGKNLHLLGFTRTNWLKYLKPYSTDSSSWRASERYGRAAVYMGRGDIQTVELRTQAPTGPVADRIRRYGVDPYALKSRESRRGMWSPALKITTMSWIEMSLDFGKVMGTRMFLAAAGTQPVELLAQNYRCVIALRRDMQTTGEAAA